MVITMVYGGYNYLEYDYEPDPENEIIVLHWVSGRHNIEKMAEGIAAESSVGTWTELKTINDKVFSSYRAHVFRIDKVSETSGFVWIAYPLEHFDEDNLLQILASIRGNIYGLSELDALKFLDISLPKKLQRKFSGPRFGLKGVRKRAGTDKEKRPHVGTIVKPKVGLSASEWADVAAKAYAGGIDFVKDDENLVNQPFCRWKDRVDEMMSRIDKVEIKTGRKVLYSPNLTDRYSVMTERMDYLKDIGWDIAMLDVYMMGYSALIDMVEELHKNGFIIHAHRAGHTAETRGPFGVEYTVFTKLWRMIGVDQLHTGTGVGKMEGSPVLIKHYAGVCRDRTMKEALHLLALDYQWDKKIKPVMPVASGGLNAGMVDALMEIYGHDVVVQAGGGVHGHPGGTEEGSKSLRQAVAAVMEGAPAPEYAKKHKELDQALDQWGYVDPTTVRRKLRSINRDKDLIAEKILAHGYDAFEWAIGI